MLPLQDIYYTLVILGILVTFGGWLLKQFLDARIYKVFIKDMATNHLPHIYHTIHLIGEKLGVEISEPPLIKFIDLTKENGNAKLGS